MSKITEITIKKAIKETTKHADGGYTSGEAEISITLTPEPVDKGIADQEINAGIEKVKQLVVVAHGDPAWVQGELKEN